MAGEHGTRRQASVEHGGCPLLGTEYGGHQNYQQHPHSYAHMHRQLQSFLRWDSAGRPRDSKYRMPRHHRHSHWRRTVRALPRYIVGLVVGCLLAFFYLSRHHAASGLPPPEQNLLEQRASPRDSDKQPLLSVTPALADSPMPQELPPDHAKPSNGSSTQLAPDLQASRASIAHPDVIDDDHERDFSRLVVFNELPASAMACFGKNVTQRFCKVRNLCYDGRRDVFFVVRRAGTFVLNGRDSNDSRLLDATSIDGHNKFFFNIVERDGAEPALQNVRVHWVPRTTFIFSRFHRLNIMHSLHDDFLGMYVLHRLFAPPDAADPSLPFARDTNLFFLDSFGVEKYDGLWSVLSAREPQKRAFWRPAPEPLCFADAVIGNSKALSWYHYGFLSPQGPLGHPVDGLVVRDAADFAMRMLGVPGWDRNAVARSLHTLHVAFLQRLARGPDAEPPAWNGPSDTGAVIALLVRTRDRLIANADELRAALTRTYGLPVVDVRMEDMDLRTQASILRRAVVAVGMHGSMLILAMFLPPGALVVELFPYAVPAEQYTPYHTLCKLKGMQLAYKAWSNRHVDRTVPHPERGPELGGIRHLPSEEQMRITSLASVPPHLCCKDPVWLFRIYQDTIVHIPELLRTIDEGLTESHELIGVHPRALYHVAPAPVEHVVCETFTTTADDGEDDEGSGDGSDNRRGDAPGKAGVDHRNGREGAIGSDVFYHMKVSWTTPWNGVASDSYGLWVHQIYQELVALNGSTSVVLKNCEPGKDYELWVRPLWADRLTGQPQLGSYSDKHTCKCMPGAHAVRDQPK